MVITELLKRQLHRGVQSEFYFWQDSNMREIDLLFEENNRVKAVEIKAGKTIPKDFARNLYSFRDLAGAGAPDLYLIYGGDTGQRRSDLGVLPWKETDTVFDKNSS